MSKSATEQFQIKKKRKHPPCNGGTSSAPQLVSAPSSLAIHPVAAKRNATPNVIVKENFAEFEVGDKHQTHALHFKPLTAAEEAADIYIDCEYNLATTAPGVSFAAVSRNCDKSAKATAAAAAAAHCLGDQSQILLTRESSIINTTGNRTKAIVMPLQHGFYVKGALARKRAMKSLKTSNSTTSIEEAKRPRRAPLATSVAAENASSIRAQSWLNAQATNNIQLSYLLGESLARHGRLQEAFDIYALISSEQLESFIPLEKLNILATALLDHIRSILSSSSKKEEDIHSQPQAATMLPTTNSTNSNTLATQWQLAVSSLTKAPTYPLKTFTSDFLNAGAEDNLDFHNYTRELTHSKTPTPQEDYDPLLCPLCRDILRCPVTTNCGHTFCRQCCETITMCNVCHIKFPRWQKEDMVPAETGGGQKFIHLTTLSTATSTTISTSSLASAVQTFGANQQYTFPTTERLATSAANDLPRLNIRSSMPGTTLALSPTTVTTTSIACTTDTATTTMASTSGIMARSVGVGGTPNSGRGSVTCSNDNMKFMPDVLVRRLVEKWWGADLQAKKILETATSYMHLNLLDDALKFCNVSLEKSPSNFKSLLLRAEVLRKMNHYQSSLADVDNALKTRYTSAKAHYLRSLALSDLSRFEEALYEICLAISLDKSANLSSTELFQHDLTKILQKLLSQTPKCIRLDLGSLRSKCPYGYFAEYRLRRRNLNLQDEEALQPFVEEDDFLSATYGKECDILAEDDVLTCTDFLNCADKRTTYASIAKKYEMELKRQTSRKHFRRKWMQKETDLLPSNDVETMRSSGQFRNVLDRLQQETVRLRKIESSPEYALKQRISVSPSLIDASDFDCVLCCRTFWKPVVTPCGHTYCLVCLDRCMDYTSSCPLCMSPLVEPSVNMQHGASTPVPLVLTKRPITKFLEAAMKHFIPDSYNKRFRQEMVLEPSVPIFICTTAFPYVPCPLFVYEPRYRLMVRRAVESGEKQFGIVQPHSGKSRYYDYGCILDIRDCVLLGDGCSILSTLGCKRFKILARNEKDGYETAKVEYIHDEAISKEHLSYVISMHDIVLEKAIDWYSSLGEDLKHEILQSYGEMPTVEDSWETRDDGPAWAWWIIALLPLRPQLKVDILATTSLEKRLRAIEKTIHSMPGNYRYQRVAQNCNVTVVVHNQQHHDLDNSLPLGPHHRRHHHHHHHHHRHHHHHHRRHDEDVEDEDVNADVDNVNDIDIDVDVDDEDDEQSTLQHHIQNMIDVDEDDVDVDAIAAHAGQQHSPHLVQHPQLQLHHQQMLQTQQQHFENVASIDECCQRTTAHEMTTAINGEHQEIHAQSNSEQQQHLHHHQNHQSAHTHSLLL